LTPPRFLVDENLSIRLPTLAHKRGFEATHVIHLGLRQWKDWNILDVARKDRWVLVTNNAIEFRSRYRAITSHPGVIFLLPSVPRQQQLELFAAALDDVVADPDLSDHALDVVFSGVTKIVVRRYALP
jgi:predicted nuclease of predicted toxin-antitoxin system